MEYLSLLGNFTFYTLISGVIYSIFMFLYYYYQGKNVTISLGKYLNKKDDQVYYCNKLIYPFTINKDINLVTIIKLKKRYTTKDINKYIQILDKYLQNNNYNKDKSRKLEYGDIPLLDYEENDKNYCVDDAPDYILSRKSNYPKIKKEIYIGLKEDEINHTVHYKYIHSNSKYYFEYNNVDKQRKKYIIKKSIEYLLEHHSLYYNSVKIEKLKLSNNIQMNINKKLKLKEYPKELFSDSKNKIIEIFKFLIDNYKIYKEHNKIK
jgi:hypothetical protein